jgi:glycosyltransferase involved in cell wall biosynthesis
VLNQLKIKLKKPITIGIDIRDLKLATTGTKTYLTELLSALKKRGDNNINLIEFSSIWPPYWGHNLFGKVFEHISFFIWKQITLPAKTYFFKVDALICTDYYLPLMKLNAKHIVVFHDALFFDHPEYYNPIWLKWFKLIAISAALKADSVIVPSQFSLTRLGLHLPTLKSKMQVVYQGPKSINATSTQSDASKIALDKIGKVPYMLHVGGLEKRKNLSFLIKALKEIRKKVDVKLLLVGRPNPKIFNNSHDEIMKTIDECGLQDDVIFTGYVPDEDLPILYKKSILYVIPSTYEGFGIPILEAFQQEVAVMVANNSCLQEIGGDAVAIFSPFNEEELINIAIEIITKDSLRRELVQKGKQRLSQFNWDASANEFVTIVQQAVSKKNII